MRTHSEPSTAERGAVGLALTLLVAALVAIVAAGAGAATFERRYGGRIYPGVAVLGIPVGGLAPMEALERTRQALEQAALPAITLHDGDTRWTVGANHLGARFDLEAAIREAWALGRSGVFRHDMAVRARVLWWGYDIVPAVALDPSAVALLLRRIAHQAGRPARAARLTVSNLQAIIGEGQAGREVDVGASYAAIERALSASLGASAWGEAPRLQAWDGADEAGPRLPTAPITVPLAFRDTLPLATDMGEAEARIDALLASPLILTVAPPDDGGATAPRRWAVDPATLAAWLTVTPASRDGVATVQVGIDREQVTQYLEGIAEALARPPREPRFAYDPATQTLTPVVPEQSGLSLDVRAAVEQVLAACDAGRREVALPMNVAPPRATRAMLQHLMPLELISEGVSGFAGSSAERLQNIRVATSRFHGVVIPPQTTFSFLQHLGPVTGANGYSESWIIYDNRTILGPGGGVCQVSTTCFRAAFWGGYPIVQRTPHYYRVAWYEPPVGLDAAVYAPSVDMAFRNDTDTPILIATEVDEAAARLVFRFYGRATGRKVAMEGPVTSNPRPPGPAVDEVDASLSPGTRVQVERPREGIDVTLVRVISRANGEAVREEFRSRYHPWPARYRVGPEAVPAGGGGSP